MLRMPLIVALAAGALAIAGCGGDGAPENGAPDAGGAESTAPGGGGPDDERDLAIAAAKLAYEEAAAAGQDLDAGPCIAEELPGLPDWVADIAHDPRQAIDNEPQNQCQRFREGEATHFVELTPEGELILAN